MTLEAEMIQLVREKCRAEHAEGRLRDALSEVAAYCRSAAGQAIESDDPVIINYVRMAAERAESVLKATA